MPDLSNQSLSEFLGDVAEDTPAPGGGTSSGVTVALAAALVEMSARLAGDSDAADRAAGLRADALRLAEEELTSYAPVLEASTPELDDVVRLKDRYGREGTSAP